MQVSHCFKCTGVLASVAAFAVIVAAIGTRADCHPAPAFPEDTTDPSAADDPASLLASASGSNPAGLAFGSAGSVREETDRGSILKFTIGGIGAVPEDSGLSGAEGLTFDGAGNLYVAHFSTRTIAKFEADGTVLFLPAAEFGPPDAFMAIPVGPIPEPSAFGVLAGIVLLGIGASGRLRRKNRSDSSRR